MTLAMGDACVLAFHAPLSADTARLPWSLTPDVL